jgi:nucleoside-diphosphate-sugar epimerase
MKVFVAGATGVVGWRAVRELVAAGHDVTGIARSQEKAASLTSLGATPARVDLFDADAVRAAVAGHDAVVNLATHVPPPARSMRPSAWDEHGRVRTESSRLLVDAALAAGASVYVQESLAFAYVDGGDEVLDESRPLLDGRMVDPVRAAEAQVARFTAAGGRGVALRFGQFQSSDSTHSRALVRAARRGVSLAMGAPDGWSPQVSCDDAARAVVAALDAPAGTYDVVDGHPRTRRQIDHALAGRPLRRLPVALLRRGGEDASLFLTSCRPSGARFRDATGWAPRDDAIRSVVATIPGESTSLLATLGLLVLAVSALGLGLYATFWPRAFYDDFPSGRHWVAVDGPYNEHLVRDFGGLNLGLGFVALLAAVVGGRWLLRAAAGSSLLFGVPHLAYHARHLEHYGRADQVANVVSLAGAVVIAFGVLLAAAPERSGPDEEVAVAEEAGRW